MFGGGKLLADGTWLSYIDSETTSWFYNNVETLPAQTSAVTYNDALLLYSLKPP